MDQDWDISAVVRPYITSSSTTSTIATTSSTPSSSRFETTSTSSNFFSLYPAQQSGHIGHGGPQQPLTMLNFNTKPFYLQPQPLSSNSFSFSSPSPKPLYIQQPNQHHLNNNSHNVVFAATSKSKRRKIQPEKICEVQSHNLSSDLWRWKKYGQKSIKGSPYPRGYFRCSSSRECLAKKQVEQKKSDPTIFTVTYFGEHNHSAPTQRNFLTGSTRQKPQVSPSTLRAEEENATPFVIDNFYKDLDKLIDLDEL